MFTIEAMVKDSRFLGFKRENPNPLVLGVSAQRQISAKHNTIATGWLEWGRGFIFSKTDSNCAGSQFGEFTFKFFKRIFKIVVEKRYKNSLPL